MLERGRGHTLGSSEETQKLGLPNQRRIHLVRHGEVENPKGIHYGRIPGFSLSSSGREQARAAGKYLRDHTTDARIVSSPLERAQETAALIAEELDERLAHDIETDVRLTEAGSWRQGLPRAFEARPYLARALDLAGRPKHESPPEIARRMQTAVSDVLEAMESQREAVVVSHQTPIRLLCVAVEHAGKITPRFFPWLYFRTRCHPGSVTTLVFEGASFRDLEYWEPA